MARAKRSIAGRVVALAIGVAAAVGLAAAPGHGDPRRPEVERMIREIQADASDTAGVTGVPRISPRVLEAFRTVPRERFVPPQLEPFAHLNRPLPLGFGQSLTMPFLAALMTEVAEVEPGDKVFETGTDTGYHAAILAELGADVHSMEVVGELHDVASRILPDLGYDEIALREGDGYFGWPEAGPFDVILIKEALDHVPPPLERQLKPGGRLVLPLGRPGAQVLTLIRKQADGRLVEQPLMPVSFTPMQGGQRI